MTIYLYVKTHKITGLKYLGKTSNKNPHKYHGSGKYWSSHLKEHGCEYDTEILCECQSNDEVREKGMYYSNLWNIVKSDLWANLKPEDGDGGITGRTSKDFTKQWKENISKAKILQNRGKDNPMYGKSHREDSRIKMSITKKALAGTPGWNIRPPCSNEKAEKIKIANTGKRWIHKKATKERKYVDPSLVAGYINVGWELGLGPRC